MTPENEQFDAQLNNAAAELGRWTPSGDPQIARRRHEVRRRRRQSMSVVAVAIIAVPGLLVARNLNNDPPAQQVQVGTNCDNQRLFVVPQADEVEPIEAQLRDDTRLKVANIHRGPDAVLWVDRYRRENWWTATRYGQRVPLPDSADLLTGTLPTVIEAEIACDADERAVVEAYRQRASTAWSGPTSSFMCDTSSTSSVVVIVDTSVVEAELAAFVDRFKSNPQLRVEQRSLEQNRDFLARSEWNGPVAVEPIAPTVEISGASDVVAHLDTTLGQSVGVVQSDLRDRCTSSDALETGPVQIFGAVVAKCSEYVRLPGSEREPCPASVGVTGVTVVQRDGVDVPLDADNASSFTPGTYVVTLAPMLIDWGCSATNTIEMTVNPDNSVVVTRLGTEETSLTFTPVDGRTLVMVGVGAKSAVCTSYQQFGAGADSLPSAGSGVPAVTVTLDLTLGVMCEANANCLMTPDVESRWFSAEVINNAPGTVPTQVSMNDNSSAPIRFSVAPGNYGLMLQTTDRPPICPAYGGHGRSPLSAGVTLTVNADGTVRAETSDQNGSAVDRTFEPDERDTPSFMTTVQLPTIGGHCG